MEVAPGKVRLNVTISEDVLSWIDRNIVAKRFSSRSHALDYGAAVLKRLSDGIGTDRRWWEDIETNSEGEDCIPFKTSPEDFVQLAYPKFDSVDQPAELTGWTRIEGYEHDRGYRLPYVYLKTVRRVKIELATDESQNIVRIRYRPAHDVGRYEPVLEFRYNLKNKRWPGTQLLPIDRNDLIFNLKELADEVELIAEDLNWLSATRKSEAADSV